MTAGPQLLAGQRVIVTGASGGLGGAIARACAAHGAVVGLGFHKNADRAAAVAGDIGGACLPLGFDVRDPAQIDAAIARFVEVHGAIDGWVNNAAENRPGLLLSADPADAERVLGVNLLGPLLCSRAVLPHMLKRRRGVLLNVSSVAAERPTRGQAVYAASKGGLEAFTRAVAVEYAKKGIRALCLRPGAIDTDMLAATRVLGEAELLARIPQGRLAAPAEVAEVAAFLLSDRAGYMTGSCVTADGGYLRG